MVSDFEDDSKQTLTFQKNNIWQILINFVPNHRWQLTRKPFWGGGLRTPDPTNWLAAAAASEGRFPTVIADLRGGLTPDLRGGLFKWPDLRGGLT